MLPPTLQCGIRHHPALALPFRNTAADPLMEIAIRRAGGHWELRPTQPYEREAQLQELLATQPNLIPLHRLGDQVLAPRVAVRELPLRPAGILDILAIDETGGLTLVECKLDANTLAGCDDVGRRFFSAVLSGVEGIGLRPEWSAVAFTIAITVDDRRVPVLRGYPAAAARGQRLTLLPGSWRSALPAEVARHIERPLASLPGVPAEATTSRIPIPVDGRFGEAQAKVIVEAVTELVKALEVVSRAGHGG